MGNKLYVPRMHPTSNSPNERLNYELSTKEDGTHELVDKSRKAFSPTEEQLQWLENWLWDWEYDLSQQRAISAVGGTMGDIRRWMRDPAFVALVGNEVKKRFDGAIPGLKMLLLQATEDKEMQLSKLEKWAIDRVLRIEESVRAHELKLVQIFNTQNNYFGGISPDMNEKQLQRIISEYSNDDSDIETIEAEAG